MATGHNDTAIFIEGAATDTVYLSPVPTPDTSPVPPGNDAFGILYVSSGDVLSPNAGDPYYRKPNNGATYDLLEAATLDLGTFVTIGTEPFLPDSRSLAVSTDLSLTDGGALGAITIGLTTVNSDALAAVISGSFVTALPETGLAQSRLLAVSSDLTLTVGVPQGSITVALTTVNSDALAAVIGGSFITALADPNLGQSRLLAVSSDLTLTVGLPQGNITVALTTANSDALAAVISGSFVTALPETGLAQSRLLAVSSDLTLTVGLPQGNITVALTTANSDALAAVIGGSFVTALADSNLAQSRLLAVSSDLTLTVGLPQGNITVALTTANSDALAAVISGSFVTALPETGLAQSRLLAVSSDLTLTVGLPQGNITVALTTANSDALAAVISGTFVTALADPNLGQSRLLAVSSDLTLTVGLPQGNITVALTTANSDALAAVISGSFVTALADSNLAQSRLLAVSSDLTLTVGPALGSITVGLTTVNSDALAAVISGSFVTALADSNLAQSRLLAVSSDLTLTVGSALGNITVGLTTVNSDALAAVISGSFVTALADPNLGQSRLLAVSSDLTLTVGLPQGNITVALTTVNSDALAAVISGSFVTALADSNLAQSRLLAVSSDLTLTVGPALGNITVGLTTVNSDALAAVISGTFVTVGLQTGLPQSRYLAVTTDFVLIDDGMQNSITIALSTVSHNAIGAVVSGSFVTALADPNLAQSRLLAVSSDLTLTVGLPQGNITVALTTVNSDALAAVISGTFVTVGLQTGLPQSRYLAVTTDFVLIDDGAQNTITIALSTVSHNAIGAVVSGSFITVLADPNLAQSRQLMVTSDLSLSDGGAQNPITIGLNTANSDALAAVISGTFVTAHTEAGLAQSRKLASGTRTVVMDGGALANITVNVDPTTDTLLGNLTLAPFLFAFNESAEFSQSRYVTAGTNVSIMDNGAGSTFVISATSPVVVSDSYTIDFDFYDGTTTYSSAVVMTFNVYKIGNMVVTQMPAWSYTSPSAFTGTLTNNASTLVPAAYRPAYDTTMAANILQGLAAVPSMSTHAWGASGPVELLVFGLQVWPNPAGGGLPPGDTAGGVSQFFTWFST